MLVIWMCGRLYHGRWSLTIGGGTWRLHCNAKSDVQTENSRACVTSPYEATSINSVYIVPLTKLPSLVYHSTNTCPVFLVWEEQGLSNLDDSWQPVYRLHPVPQLHPAGSKVDWQLCLLPLCCHVHGEVQVNQTHQRTEYKAWHSGLCIEFKVTETFRFWDEYDYEYEISSKWCTHVGQCHFGAKMW